MGLFGMFRKDAGAELDKAAGWLETGEAVRALETARRYVGDRDAAHRTRALDLVTAARAALVRNGRDKAAQAEAAGDFADAADWMRAAIQHAADDDAERAELAERLATLERRAAIGRREPEAWEQEASRGRTGAGSVATDRGDPDLDAPAPGSGGRQADDREAADRDGSDQGGDDRGGEGALADEPWPDDDGWIGDGGDGADFDDPETRYELLVDTLEDGVGERYRGRSDAFRAAFLQLNDGEVEAAAAAFDGLVAAGSADAVVHFERGRARLLLGDAAGARQDLEAAWPELGDEPLDRAGALRVPTLWAEAALAGDDAEAVAERLDGLAAASRRDADLAALHARALVATARLEDARDLLGAAVERFSQRPDLALALAQVLHRLGGRQAAIHVLERSVAPSCASGSCQRPPLHLPSLRSLAALHLGAAPPGDGAAAGEAATAEGDAVTAANLDRVEDLMRWIAGAQGGRLAAADHLLAARYHEVCDEPERAEEARRRAASLAAEESAGPTEGAAVVGDLAPVTGRAVL